jgi:hypothetical protein
MLLSNLRLVAGGPFSHDSPPFSSFPDDLKSIIAGPNFLISGGLQIDGRPIAEVVPEEVAAACDELKKRVSVPPF